MHLQSVSQVGSVETPNGSHVNPFATQESASAGPPAQKTSIVHRGSNTYRTKVNRQPRGVGAIRNVLTRGSMAAGYVRVS
jgi:hypothetical protein